MNSSAERYRIALWAMFAAWVSCLAGAAMAQEAVRPDARRAPSGRTEITLSFAPVVRQVAPAVVNVYGARRVQSRQRNPFADDPFFREFFGGGRNERVQQSVGSGVIVGADGTILTNHHVVEGMTELRVALPDRREFDAEIVLRDPRTDLAVLKVKGGDGKFPVVAFGDSDQLEVGDLVLAIGNPFGVGQTVTQGIVSALARTQVGVTDYQFFIQTDAAINPGNSGGALVDINGRLIGINTAIFSRSGGSHGIGFAIPSSMARIVVESARGGSVVVRRPWFGARLQAVGADVAESLGLDRPTGALVAHVQENGPAAEAGLRRGDVIVAVDGQEVTDPETFGYRFATRGVSGQSTVTVLRGGKRTLLPIRLAVAPETRPREPIKVRGRSPFTGATVMNLSPAVAEELSIELALDGVAIGEVEEGSPAQQLGFLKGDVILTVNGERVATTKDLDRLAARGAYGWRIRLNRGGQELNTVIGG